KRVEKERRQASRAERHLQAEHQQQGERTEQHHAQPTDSDLDSHDQAIRLVTIMKSLISMDSPCSSSSAAPIGIVSLTGQYCTPHSVNECSPTWAASSAKRALVHNMVPTKMKKNSELTMSAIALPRGEKWE